MQPSLLPFPNLQKYISSKFNISNYEVLSSGEQIEKQIDYLKDLKDEDGIIISIEELQDN